MRKRLHETGPVKTSELRRHLHYTDVQMKSTHLPVLSISCLLVMCASASEAFEGSTGRTMEAGSPPSISIPVTAPQPNGQPGGTCVPGPTTLCLNGGRFRVEVSWTTAEGTSGAGRAVGITTDTGYFWFFNSRNVELVVKVLEACVFNSHRWVFAAGLTNVDVRLVVTDTLTGIRRTYHNPQGTPYRPLQDTAAFQCGSTVANPTGSQATGENSQVPHELFLNQDRFKVEVVWQTPKGGGRAQAESLTDDTGYFWFFNSSNVEIVIKVLNACSTFGRYWVFVAGLTNVEVDIEVTDTFTGTTKRYGNPLGRPFPPILDTNAFSTCATQTDFALFSNPGDPLLLRARTAHGEQVDYFGEKDARGVPLSCSTIETRLSSGASALIQLDGLGRPVHGLSSNGVSMDILWLSDHEISFSATSPDGRGQVSVVVDLLTQQTSQPLVSMLESPPRAMPYATRFPGTTGGLNDWQLNEVTTAFGASSTESRVMVSRCAAPVNDAFVEMLVTPEAGAAYALPGTHVGAGQYLVTIPSSPSDGAERAGEICEGTAATLDLACLVIEVLGPAAPHLVCGAVAAAISAVGGLPGAPAILAACEVLFSGVIVYCETLGQGIPGGPSIAEVLCEDLPDLIDRFVQGDVALQPSANIRGGGVFTAAPQVAPAVGPFPDFTISATGQVQIGRFFAIPPDPAPQQGYTATAEILCAPPSTRVVLSIVGTDGYTDSATCFVTGDSTCSIAVPGAAAGVVDTVRAEVTGGPSRQIVLVF